MRIFWLMTPGLRERLRAQGFTHALVSIRGGEVRSRHRSKKAALRALAVPLQAYYRVERI